MRRDHRVPCNSPAQGKPIFFTIKQKFLYVFMEGEWASRGLDTVTGQLRSVPREAPSVLESR